MAGLPCSAAAATPAPRAPAAIPQPSQRQELQDSLEHSIPLFVSVGRRWPETEPRRAQLVRTACGRPAGLSSPKYASVRPHQNPRVRINARAAEARELLGAGDLSEPLVKRPEGFNGRVLQRTYARGHRLSSAAGPHASIRANHRLGF